MSNSIVEKDDLIIADAFYSDKSHKEKEMPAIDKPKVKKSKICKNTNNKLLQRVFLSDTYNQTDTCLNDKSKKKMKKKNNITEEDATFIENIGNHSSKVNTISKTRNYFNFENDIYDSDSSNANGYADGKNVQEKNNKSKIKCKKNKNNVWYDSDDELILNPLSKSNYENENENEEHFAIETNEDNVVINKEDNKNMFEKYIEKVKIESYDQNENDSMYNLHTDDIYIFDDKELNIEIQSRKKRNKVSEKSIFLKYYLQQFTINHIDEQKIKQIATIPNKKLILPVYNSNLYMLEYRDKQLQILKKISFNRKIKYVEPFDENLYILSYDNFIRNYNIEKGIVYKSRIHYDSLKVSIPKEIKFFDANSNAEGVNKFNSNLFSMSFCKNGKINLYDKRSFDIIKTFEMSNNYIGMNFHRKSNSLFAIDENGFIYNWCLNTNKLINKIMDNYSVFPSVFNIHNDYLVTCSFNGFLNLFNINNLTEPIKSFKNLTLRVNDAIFDSHNYLLYYTRYQKNGLKLIDLNTKYVYCNIPWFNTNVKYNIYAANFFNNGNNLCFAVKPNSFYVYDIFNKN